MAANPKDFSDQQRAVILMLSLTAGMTARQINAALNVKSSTALLDSLRNRGVAKSVGHYAPMRCKWLLTDAGAALQKAILKVN